MRRSAQPLECGRAKMANYQLTMDGIKARCERFDPLDDL